MSGERLTAEEDELIQAAIGYYRTKRLARFLDACRTYIEKQEGEDFTLEGDPNDDGREKA